MVSREPEKAKRKPRTKKLTLRKETLRDLAVGSAVTKHVLGGEPKSPHCGSGGCI